MPDISKCALITTIFAIAAFALSIASTVWCSFVERDVDLEGNDPFPTIRDELREFLLEDHGVGFWGWELGGQCFDYTINRQDPDFDTKYNSARAFTIVSVILGGIVMFALLFSSCTAKSTKFFLCCSVGAVLTCLFQGLTLLIFTSDICEPGFFGYSTGVDEDLDIQGIDVDCSLSAGSRCAISATVLWFVVAVMSAGVAKKKMQIDDAEAHEEKGDASPEEEAAPPEEAEAGQSKAENDKVASGKANA